MDITNELPYNGYGRDDKENEFSGSQLQRKSPQCQTAVPSFAFLS